MRILILSFYYQPDLSACSFRTTALVRALLEVLPPTTEVDVITTLPHRYGSFTEAAVSDEDIPRLRVHRIALPAHGGGMLGQALAFLPYVRGTMKATKGERYDLVYGTSSRLMTAALSAHVARRAGVPLYLDIRDIFVDTIKDVLPGWAATAIKPVLSRVEAWTIRSATVVNLVSRGFERYFVERYPRQRYSYFPNGIDEEFLDADWEARSGEPGRPMRILYAGNIGEGQGLHAIVPDLAARMAERAEFVVIGDGGRKRELVEALERSGVTNVRLLPPMARPQLIDAYRDADVLFLHLNDYPAFEKVLPSKVFEYAATGKPVWAGVAGHAAGFVSGEIDNAAVFAPCDADDALRSFDALVLERRARRDFLRRYGRPGIMREMAQDIAGIGTRRDSAEAPATPPKG